MLIQWYPGQDGDLHKYYKCVCGRRFWGKYWPLLQQNLYSCARAHCHDMHTHCPILSETPNLFLLVMRERRKREKLEKKYRDLIKTAQLSMRHYNGCFVQLFKDVRRKEKICMYVNILICKQFLAFALKLQVTLRGATRHKQTSKQTIKKKLAWTLSR